MSPLVTPEKKQNVCAYCLQGQNIVQGRRLWITGHWREPSRAFCGSVHSVVRHVPASNTGLKPASCITQPADTPRCFHVCKSTPQILERPTDTFTSGLLGHLYCSYKITTLAVSEAYALVSSRIGEQTDNTPAATIL